MLDLTRGLCWRERYALGEASSAPLPIGSMGKTSQAHYRKGFTVEQEIRDLIKKHENDHDDILRLASVRLSKPSEFIVAYGYPRGRDAAILGAWEAAKLQRSPSVLTDIDATCWRWTRHQLLYRYGIQGLLTGL